MSGIADVFSLPPSWMDRAACKDADPADFFPEPGESHKAAAAKAVCAECPVAAQCLQWAVANNCHDGVFGGLSAVDRMRVSKGAQPVICPDCGRMVWSNGLATHKSRWCGRQVVDHSHSTYSAGRCKCAACRSSHAAYERDRRRRFLDRKKAS